MLSQLMRTPLNSFLKLAEAHLISPQVGLLLSVPDFLAFVPVPRSGRGRERRHSCFLLCPVLGRSKASL